jgi:integrase
MLELPRDLTDAAIAILTREPCVGPRELSDPTQPDLRLLVGAGTAEWMVVTQAKGGVRLRMPLGVWPALGPADARAAAQSLKVGVPALPQSPDLTVGTMLARYTARRLVQLRRGDQVGRALERTLHNVLDKDPCSVSRRELAAIIDEAAEHAPISANRCLSYTKAFFAWSVGRGYIDANPASGISRPTRERARERTPSLAELVEIWWAADEIGYPFGTAIQSLMLTAARRDEIGEMEWTEVDWGSDVVRPSWSLPAHRSKNRRALRNPLSSLALNILQKAKASQTAPGRYVFSTGRVAGPISGWSKAKARIDRLIVKRRAARSALATDLVPWRVHDLRRSFATLACDELQIDPAIADRCLNHVGSSTTSTISRVYGRSEMFEPRRDALQRWADLLATAIETGRPTAINPESASP